MTLDNPSANDELDTPTSIASVVTSTNESSTETDTPQQTDTEVQGIMFGHTFGELSPPNVVCKRVLIDW